MGSLKTENNIEGHMKISYSMVQTPTCFALLPKTNSMASITLDLPLPFGPTTEEKHCMAIHSISSVPPFQGCGDVPVLCK
jgi:hypothetical protein